VFHTGNHTDALSLMYEKTLRNRIIVTIALPAHALDKTMAVKHITKISERG